MRDFLPALGVFLTFGLIAMRVLHRYAANERPLLWCSFLAHQVAAASNILVYVYYYGYGDMLTYHQSGMVIAERLRGNFWGLSPSILRLIFHGTDPVPVPIETFVSSSGTMQGVAGFLAFFLFDSLYAACALIAGLAFLAKVALYDLACEELPDVPRKPLLWASALIPSAVFWSSSLLKEPLAMAGMLFALRAGYRIQRGVRSLGNLLIFVAGACAVLLVKGYIVPVLALACAAWYLLNKVRRQQQDILLRVGNLALAAAGAIAIITLTGLFLPTFAAENVQEKLANQQALSSAVDAGSNYSLGALSGTAAGQVVLAPFAMLTALFRPSLFEAKNALMGASALENTVLLAVLLWLLARSGISKVLSTVSRQPYLAFCAIFSGLFAALTGLGSTNLGTLSRYRAPLMPFFATLLLVLAIQRRQVASPAKTMTHRSSAGRPVEGSH